MLFRSTFNFCILFVSYEDGAALAEKENLIFLEVSAKTADNVNDAFMKSAANVYQLIKSGVLDPRKEVRTCSNKLKIINLKFKAYFLFLYNDK